MYTVQVTNKSGFWCYVDMTFDLVDDIEMAHRVDRSELDTFLASVAICHPEYSVAAYPIAS